MWCVRRCANTCLRSTFCEEVGAGVLDRDDRRTAAVCLLGVDIMEMYSQKRITEACARFGLLPGSSLELTNGWDLSELEPQRRAWTLTEQDEPTVPTGSPPCTMCCIAQHMRWRKFKGSAEWRRKFERQPETAK